MEVFIRPCQSGRSLEALPSPKLNVDITALEERLVDAGWNPLVNAGIMLIARKDHEVTIYQTGKVLIKSLEPNVAQRLWDELAPHLVAVSSA